MTINLPKLIGHRGVRGLAPENTIQSIKKAIELNIKWVEIDVKISKDRIPFLLHDSNLERTTSGKGSPLNYKYNELYKLDAGSWFDKKYKNLYPPTLKEILDLCSQKNIGVNIELKPNKGFEEANVVAITELIMKYKFNCQYFLSSFDWFSVIKIRK
ncbi:MAG TPA: glycerophosphodiester phosphodiesterase family protein, partial [Alphaproteobacteria bacterium]|nr:glycerophosphodiester phosphodiesterase family protein [Alphaproteobacteria bacterium]